MTPLSPAPAAPAPSPNPLPKRRRWKRALGMGLLLCTTYVGCEYIRLPGTKDLVKQTPPQSALMRERLAEAQDEGVRLKLHQSYVPLSRITRAMQHAVILSEDARFWTHNGIDWTETSIAMKESWEAHHLKRGASTITQQLAKNLYLSEDRSVVRKLKEWMLAHRLEENLSKQRILELYLNFAEWGNGVFGVETAARTYFGHSAATLSPAEAAVLTAMLPAPRKRSIKHPSRRFVHRAREVADLLIEAGLADGGIRSQVDAILGIESTAADDADDTD